MTSIINNNQGSAIAIVLLFLAVLSLMGVGLLTQSRLDVRLTAAIKSYSKMFNLADGASMMAYKELKTTNQNVAFNNSMQPVTYKVVDDTNPSKFIEGIEVPGTGKYSANTKCIGYSTDSQDTAGWEVGEYFAEFWLAEGKSERHAQLFGKNGTSPKSEVELAIVKTKRVD
jgi:hypothetical protein